MPSSQSPHELLRRALGASLLFLAAVYLINFGLLGFLIGPFDYDHLSGYYELAWRFWRTDGGLPGFNPYLCGGRTLGGDPQIPIFHPLVVLVPGLGATVILKGEMLLQLTLGAWGFDACLRRFGAGVLGRFWGLILFVAGGGVVARFLVGHVTLGFFFLYPLFLYLSYRIDDPGSSPRLLVLYVSLFVYATLYKPNFLIYGAPPLLLEAAVRSALRRSPRPLRHFLAALATGALVGSVSLFPAWKYFRDFPRLDDTVPHLVAPYALGVNLLLPLKTIPQAWYGPGFMQRHEYNVFLGPVALFFAWLGFRKIRSASDPGRAEKLALVAFTLASAWLGLGAPEGWPGELFPFRWFSSVWPGFRSIRVPPRFWFGAFLGLSLLSGLGFRPPRARRGAHLVLWLGVLPLLLSATVNLCRASVAAAEVDFRPRAQYPARVEQVMTEVHSGFPSIRKGKSLLECFRNLENFQSPALRPGDMLSPLVPFPGEFHAEWAGWSRIRLRARAEHPARLTLNLNHSPYWHFSGTGATVVSRLGSPLTLHVTGGEVQGNLVFEQPWVAAALAVSLLSAGVFLLWAAWVWKNGGGERCPKCRASRKS